ncbi:single-stranded-DNA-specific exonuclease RecJ [Thalassoglobus polymorphus]|uniref:Single-stranded-DNA-specific exonuclease RecJ n=1 Tax=Thalassoglobus polymorphus TaxID=2527994 RepID=A0A517QT92_9PLAN|nr:single-stranded-DNA-specific exonuclease RecJ [Thalassoglobus polymorphus]QDT34865.1 Single-stranded-DNA-specific exonuclease RecJ [Thalassoglobus polymorphus]
MPKQWRFAPHDQGAIKRLTKEMSCSPLLAQVLAARGIESKEQALKLYTTQMKDLHDPGLLPGVEEASDRMIAAMKSQRRITIYGDYDVDGVTATSILWHCLKLAGAKVDYYIPCRLEEGYGLNLEAIRTLHEEDPDRLVITVDCGICSLKEAALAKELGLELIITDHHTMLDELPDAATNVHPRLPGSEYPFKELCGAGVAFKLAWAVCQKLGDGTKASPRMREYLKSAVGLAAIGTVADVVPLIGENRIIVQYGLSTLLDKSMTGLSMLLKVANLDEQKELSAEDIGFGIGPRINAAGRLGQARLAVELLTTENRQRAAQLADYMDQLNKDRQKVERKIYKQAKEQIEENPEWLESGALVLASEDWHPGVIGIVASRIAEKYERPTIMIAMNAESGIGQGSGRSFHGYDLHSGLSACSELLEAFGGHKAAAGLRVKSEQLDDFRQTLGQIALEDNSSDSAQPELDVDAEVTLHDLTHRAVKELDWLGPYGAAHRRPIFSASNIELVEPPKKMGGGERHLSLRVRDGSKVLRAVAFGKGEWADEMQEAITGPFSICFTTNMNRFRGYETVELKLVDWQPSVQHSKIRST